MHSNDVNSIMLISPKLVASKMGRSPPQNLPTLNYHLRTKFHPDPSSSLDFYREQTHTQTNIAHYLVDGFFRIVRKVNCM